MKTDKQIKSYLTQLKTHRKNLLSECSVLIKKIEKANDIDAIELEDKLTSKIHIMSKIEGEISALSWALQPEQEGMEL